jgi:transposase
MSTKMDEDDWAHTVAVFRACLPRRGRKANDDRRFLEALHFFTVENVRWRALPERFGHWNQRVETLRSLEQGRRLRGVL